MKISKPSGHLGASVPEVNPSQGKGFAEKLSQTSQAEGVQPTSVAPDVRRTGSIEGLADLSAEVKAGRITAQAALDTIIDRIVVKQVGPNAPAAVRDRISIALRQTLRDDPLLAAKVKMLEDTNAATRAKTE